MDFAIQTSGICPRYKGKTEDEDEDEEEDDRGITAP